MDADPGLKGVVPFRFQCQRSGHCCTGGTGYVWVEEDELPALAQAAGYEQATFERELLRRVLDPKTGVLRLSLREGPAQSGGSGDACVLLEGARHCTVYDARPRHCRSYPYSSSILNDREGFEQARSTCPGIQPLPDPAAQAAAFAELEQLYLDVDKEIASHTPRCEMSGVCCRFEEAGHVLYATSLETDYAISRHPTAAAPEAPGRCPYHVKGMCTARAGRPLGCRTYFCDPLTEDVLQQLHETYLAAVRKIEREHSYAPGYAPFPALLESRGLDVDSSTAAEGEST